MENTDPAIAALEAEWARLEKVRYTDEASYGFGSFNPAVMFDIANFIHVSIPLVAHPNSSFRRDAELLRRIQEQIDYLRRIQLPSGCISLIACNIDSPPDTAFAVHSVALCYQAAVKSRIPELEGVIQGMRQFMEHTLPCLLTGGIHTPNHRWVLCGALALLYEIFGDEALKKRAFDYIGEGFDMNAAGEWTERSNAIYNPICNLFLYHAGRVFQYEEAYASIRQNLSMMRYMLHPGGAVVTEYSSRQDLGEIMMLNEDYEVICRLMAAKDGNPQFGALANLAAANRDGKGKSVLYELVFPDEMKRGRSASSLKDLPDRYTVLLNEGARARVSGTIPPIRQAVHSGAPIVRHRNGKLSVTLMSGQENFLYVQYGSARIVGIKLSLGWFGIAGVPFSDLKRIDESRYELSLQLEGSYRGPLDHSLAASAGGAFFDMPNEQREKTHITALPVVIGVEWGAREVHVDLRVDAVPHLFAQLIVASDRMAELSGDMTAVMPNAHLLNGNAARIRQARDCMEIVAGACEHDFITLRNDHLSPNAQHLICNYMTPLNRRFTIRCSELTTKE
ncbi:hypothetical protein [Paenibacillus methanolicus]|uniref:Heparinase II/III-like protein n=1 Tax=Paenibacillus methanolicus TaxID=582686 RepID=A0A5S5CHP4_9BACL|nr:hypothetical protein [Paenibacillus methanolicus]TYP79280.1 hypothetical protein BCM02_101398 [Paenibacillus methanolicus]